MDALNAYESLKIISAHGIPTTGFEHANSSEKAMEAAQKLGFPIALKGLSPQVIHKTEFAAVKIGLNSVDEVNNAFFELEKLEGFEGVLVQQMAFGTEIIIGGKQDEQFGQTILFGLGGIFVEILKDYSLRICPITLHDAHEMIQEIKGLPILLGARGKPKVNLTELENILVKTSQMLEKETEIKELDINPLFANEKQVVAVDARIIL